MKIVILTQYFPPDKPGGIPYDVATELSNRNHDVKVLTTFPHYTTSRAEGYRQRLHHVENHGKIQVRRVPIIPSHSRNSVGRAANYLSFALAAGLAKEFVRDADVIYVHGTPATVAAPARKWSRSLGIPFVYSVQDIWPESVTESGLLPKPLATFARRMLTHWLGNVYSSASAVNVIAPTARELLIQRGVPVDNCHLVYNWFDNHSDVEGKQKQRLPGLTHLYAGNLGPLQDLETVIRAAARLGELQGFRLLIAGSGIHEDHLRRLAVSLNAHDTVKFLGQLPAKQMSGLYADADFQVVPLKNLEIFRGTIPSKLQAGLAHGLPVITTAKGDVTQLVNEHALGFSALPEDTDSLASAFRRAYETSPEERQRFSQRARAFYQSHFTKSNAVDRIEAVLQSAAASGQPRARGARHVA